MKGDTTNFCKLIYQLIKSDDKKASTKSLITTTT